MTTKKQKRLTISEILEVLHRVDLGEVLYDRPMFTVQEKGDGYLLQLQYYEADTDTKDTTPVIQKARKWYISPYSTETEIVRTAYKAVKTSLEHRLGEHFTYCGQKIYSPHLSVKTMVNMLKAVQDPYDTRTPPR